MIALLEVYAVPLYEYECSQCGRFELIQKFADVALLACPTCGKDVQKLISAPAFQFKGTGWYVTDYGRKPEGSSATSGEAPAESKSGSSDAAKPTASSSTPASSTTAAPPASSPSSE